MELTITTYGILFVVSIFAGLVDSIAGGGGLIMLPTLMACGFPPTLAIGTNKIGAVCGTFTAARHYAKQGLVDWRECRLGFSLTLVGAALGAWTVQHVETRVLEKLVPLLLAALLVYTIFKPKLGEDDRHAKMGLPPFYLIFGIGIGFYDGFFGPGTGTFWALAFVTLLGHNFARATAHTKVMNFASGVASLCLFIAGKKVLYLAGGSMAVGQIIGSRLGAGLVVSRGALFVRPLFLIMASALLLKLVYNLFAHA